MNIYYELSTNRPVVLRYWVQSNAKQRSDLRINYNYKLMGLAERVWMEEGSEVRYIKNRYEEVTNDIVDDTERFSKVKLLARDLDMMSMRKFDEDTIYISFPPMSYSSEEYRIPDGLEEWLEENVRPQWGIIKGQRAGVFLSEQDATAFKLKWM